MPRARSGGELGPPIKVVVISRSGFPFPSPPGGADNVALRQATELSRAGASVVLVGQGALPNSTDPGNLELLSSLVGKDILSRTATGYFFRVLSFSVMSTLRGIGYVRRHPEVSVVHCHHSSSVFLVRLFSRVPITYTVHDLPYSHEDSGRGWIESMVRVVNNLLMERWATSHVDWLIAVSPSIAERLHRWEGKGAAISVIPPIAQERPISFSSESAKLITASVGVAAPFLLSVGNLTGRKRMDLLVRAMPDIHPSIRLVIVGRGAAGQGLRHLIEELGLSPRVILLDYVSDSVMEALQRSAEAAVLVSEREGFPTSLIEAARVGTPVVYCSTESLPLTVTSKFVRHVVYKNPKGIAEAIGSTLEDARRESWRRSEIRDWALKTFPSGEQAARELLEIYRKVSEVRRVEG